MHVIADSGRTVDDNCWLYYFASAACWPARPGKSHVKLCDDDMAGTVLNTEGELLTSRMVWISMAASFFNSAWNRVRFPFWAARCKAQQPCQQTHIRTFRQQVCQRKQLKSHRRETSVRKVQKGPHAYPPGLLVGISSLT